MNLRFLSYFTVCLSLLSAAVSCNKNDDDNTTTNYSIYSNTTTLVSSFSLTKDDKVLHHLDSVFFTIDQDRGMIYNADSLPKGTNVSKLCVNMTSASTVSKVEFLVTGGKVQGDKTITYTSTTKDTIDFSGDIATVEAAIAADPLFAPNTTIEWYIVDADGNLTAAKNYVVSAENQSLKLVYKLINNECGTSLTSAEATFDVVPHTDSLDIIKGKFVDKNLVDTTIARPAGATLSDEGTEVTWYRVGTGANGEDEILDWKTEAQSKNGYYIAAKERAALTGSYYVVINIQGANGCGSVLRSNIWECATPTAATPRLTPNRVNAGEPMWLIDLNAEEDTHVRIYDASGKMMNELHYNAAQQQLIPTVGTSGMYLLHVVNGAVETTLKYMLK